MRFHDLQEEGGLDPFHKQVGTAFDLIGGAASKAFGKFRGHVGKAEAELKQAEEDALEAARKAELAAAEAAQTQTAEAKKAAEEAKKAAEEAAKKAEREARRLAAPGTGKKLANEKAAKAIAALILAGDPVVDQALPQEQLTAIALEIPNIKKRLIASTNEFRVGLGRSNMLNPGQKRDIPDRLLNQDARTVTKATARLVQNADNQSAMWTIVMTSNIQGEVGREMLTNFRDQADKYKEVNGQARRAAKSAGTPIPPTVPAGTALINYFTAERQVLEKRLQALADALEGNTQNPQPTPESIQLLAKRARNRF